MSVSYRRDRGGHGRRRRATRVDGRQSATTSGAASASSNSPALTPAGSRSPDDITRDEALRRIAAEASGRTDLSTLFDDVIGYSVALFAADRVGLWLIDEDVHPFRLAAHRGLSPALRAAVARLKIDSAASGALAIRERHLRVVREARLNGTTPELREAYRQDGIETVCFVPIVFRDRPLGLLALYHETLRDWPAAERDLAAAFADQMATAIENARLYEATRDLAARLRAIQDLGARLNRIQDSRGIGEAIVAEVRRLIDHDNIRVYRIDHATGMCEPITFQGAFMGIDAPTAEMLRCRVGDGLTGWVAEHNESIVVGDAENDPRRILVGAPTGPESMLIVPMTYDDRVEGVIALAKLGRDRFTADHEATLSIFAGHAAQAFVSADNAERVRRQQGELERRLASQRRLLEVNETLLSTLDPQTVLEMIAGLAQGRRRLRLTDHLSGRPARRAVRRPVVARDRFADVIMDYVGPLGIGLTGWVIERNEAGPGQRRPSRHALDPDPGHARRAGVDDRRPARWSTARSSARSTSDGWARPRIPFRPERVRADQAVRRPGLDRPPERRGPSGRRGPGRARLADRPAQPRRVPARARRDAVAAADGSGFAVLMMDLDAFKAFNDTLGHPAGDLRSCGRSAVRSSVPSGTSDRAYRYGGDEFAVLLPGLGRQQAQAIAERIRVAVAEAAAAETAGVGPVVTISIGIATFPGDGRAKDALVRAADADLYRVKPTHTDADRAATVPGDAYLAALNETAVALMDRLDPTELLTTIVQRAADLVGTPHGFVYLVDGDTDELVMRVGTGLYADYVDYRVARGSGVAGTVWATGRPFVVDDYDALATRDPVVPAGTIGAAVGIPLASDGSVIGVLGLASGSSGVTFGEQQVEVLQRFAELASLAIDNARLHERAKHEVDERSRAENALRASEERYRRLSDATSEALAIHRGGVILEVNAAFCRLLGYDAEDCIGRTILDFASPETMAAVRDGELSTALATESTAPLEVTARSSDGTLFPVEVAWRQDPLPRRRAGRRGVRPRPARASTARSRAQPVRLLRRPDRPAEPGPAARPDDPRPVLHPARRRRSDRVHPARPRPVQSDQRESRPRRRGSAPGTGRAAPVRVPPTRRHRGALRR